MKLGTALLLLLAVVAMAAGCADGQRIEEDADATLQRYVREVEDTNRSSSQRRRSFVAFWRAVLKPGSDLVAISNQYGLKNWITSETLMDLTHSSSTPMEELRSSDSRAGIYVVTVGADYQDNDAPVYVCFAVASWMTDDEVLDALVRGKFGVVVVSHVSHMRQSD